MPKRRAIDEDSDEECQPTIEPKEAAERYISAVKASRINKNARCMLEYTMEDLMTDNDSRPVLYVPAKSRARILRLYGGHTIEDFDQLYSFNSKIGAPYDNCFRSMMFYMNQTEGDLEDQWQKVAHERVISDVFNLVQSAVRSRVGECVWYE